MKFLWTEPHYTHVDWGENLPPHEACMKPVRQTNHCLKRTCKPNLGCTCGCDACCQARHDVDSKKILASYGKNTDGKKMPKQKPGKSEQTVETPWEFIDAVERQLRRLTFDLAATSDNCKVRHPSVGETKRSSHYGPGSARGEDSLQEDWSALPSGNFWLNPPYSNIQPWAAKCWETLKAVRKSGKGQRTLLLVPASVGSNWWADYVHLKATVYFLRPRLTFVGHDQGYPKDLALCEYSGTAVYKPSYFCWRWDSLTLPR